MDRTVITLFTDGSWCPTTNLSGWAVSMIWGVNVTLQEAGCDSDIKDSTASELLSILRGLEIIRERVLVNDPIVIIASNCPAAYNPACWRGFLEKHPQYTELVSETLKMSIKFKKEFFNQNDEEWSTKINKKVDMIARESLRRARKQLVA